MTTNNHPAHGPVSLDRLHQIHEILSKAAAQSDGGNLGYAMADAVKVIDEVLERRKADTDRLQESAYKAGLTAGWNFGIEHNSTGFSKCLAAHEYTAPPAPVVPKTLPCSVELKPGLIIGKGCKTETLLTALKRRADFYAELNAMTPEEKAEYDKNIEAFKEMLPQPAPVVPEEIPMPKASMMNPIDAVETIAEARGWNACRAAMLKGAEPVSQTYKLPEEKGASLQLRNLIRKRHAEWSDATFGDVGPIGPLKHLSKEALEAAAEPDDLSEWADMQFLLWDAQRRAGISDGEITAAMEEKLKVNMARQWPEPKDGEPRLHIKEQPAPIVPPAIEPDYKVIKSILPTANPDEYACCIAADMWNACRAAMLNGGKS